MTSKRLKRELDDINKDPPPNVSAGSVGNDLFHWIAIIVGQYDTPYLGGVFRLDITFPEGNLFYFYRISF